MQHGLKRPQEMKFKNLTSRATIKATNLSLETIKTTKVKFLIGSLTYS